MEETISLQEIFTTIKKRLTMIILITVLAVAVAGVTSYFVLTPVYQASAQILVNQKQSGDKQDYNQGQIQANQDLVNTYSVIVKSPTILDKVIEQLNLKQTTKQLSEQLTVNSEENSQVFNVAIDNEDPAKATTIVNTIAEVFQKQIPNIMDVDNASILSKADLGPDPAPVKPNPTLNMALALVVGLMIGVGLAFLLEYLDNTVKSEEDVEKQLGLPVLGAVTEMASNNNSKRSHHSHAAKRHVGGETLES